VLGREGRSPSLKISSPLSFQGEALPLRALAQRGIKRGRSINNLR